MLLSDTVTMKWNSNNKSRYEQLGYIYTKMRDPFIVRVIDLPSSSHIKVLVKCDYCGKIIERQYVDYLKCHSQEDGDACLNCKQIKTEHTNLQRYGFKSTAQHPDVKAKQIATNMEKYGCKSYFQTDEFKNKSQATCIKKYGVPYALQSDKIKEKLFQTNLSKYGNKCSLHCIENAEKTRQTNLAKYGVEYSLQSKEIRAKGVKTLCEKQNVATSKQQLKIYNMLLEMYGNCELNYTVSYCSLDCLVNINDSKIDIEYDGWYWHKNMQKRDRRRDEFLKSQGYKILRIKASRNIPTKEQLKNAINHLIKNDYSYTEIILDI